MPVGLAANGERNYVFRPDSSPEHQGRLMESLAEVRALGSTSLERFLYDLRAQLSRFNTLTIITPSIRSEWIPALSSMRRLGVSVGVVLIDAKDFSGATNVHFPVELLFANEIPTFMVRKGQALNEALSHTLDRADYLAAVDRQAAAREAVR